VRFRSPHSHGRVSLEVAVADIFRAHLDKATGSESARLHCLAAVEPTALVTGVVQIDTAAATCALIDGEGDSEGAWADLWLTIQRELQRGEGGGAEPSPPSGLPRWQHAIQSLGGVLQGLCDFHFVEAAELLDVFSPVSVSDGLLGLHTSLAQQLENVHGRLDEVRAAIESRFQTAVTLLGIVLAIAQVLSGWNALVEFFTGK
jgi:hypothetical protein